METRKVRKEDFEFISQRDNTLTKELFDTADLDSSALTIADNGILLSVVLTRINPIVDTFPNRRFPKSRHNYWLRLDYTEKNNHQVAYLYRFERNGFAIRETMKYLMDDDMVLKHHFWWINSNDKYVRNNFTKVCSFFLPIRGSNKYYRDDIYMNSMKIS